VPTKPELDGRRDLNRAAAVRALVVEDFEPFRQFITSTLAGVHNLQVVGEVSDGLATVQLAVELQPDLILLDTGLPTLNDFEAARQIRKTGPGIQNTLLGSGIFCWRGARSSEHRRVGLRCENTRWNRATRCCGSSHVRKAVCE